MSALLMAIFFNGLGTHELNTWTDRMIESGERLDCGDSVSHRHKPSTGGVGDKISADPRATRRRVRRRRPATVGSRTWSRRTLDKLESIPGWRAFLSNDEIRDQLDSVGAVICAAARDWLGR